MLEATIRTRLKTNLRERRELRGLARAMNTDKDVSGLHAEYLRLIGGDLSLTLDRRYWWGQWSLKGWGAPELELVIRHIQSQIRKGKRFEGALRWSRLIQQADAFEEELILARAEKRNSKPKPAPRENALQSFRPCVVDVQTRENTRTASEAAEKALAALRASVEIR